MSTKPVRHAHDFEEWRDVVGYEGLYSVSDYGSVWSKGRNMVGHVWPQARPPRMLRPFFNDAGYPTVELYDADGSSKQIGVHRLVAAAFLGPRPHGEEVCHGDGDPGNARLKNLRYGSHSENMLDAVAHGTLFIRRGVDHPKAKLTEEIVLSIKNDPRLQRLIAEEHSISLATVGRIKRGETWTHLNKPVDEVPS